MKNLGLILSLFLTFVLILAGCSASNISYSGTHVSPPVLINGSQPFYPLEASQQALEGQVTLLLNISEDGKVSQMTIKESSGSDLLDKAALRYAKNLTFQPALENDKHIPVWISWVVRYVMDGSPSYSKDFNVLVYSKTSGYRHQSIEKGMSALKVMALENNFGIEFTEDSTMINDNILSGFNVLIFLNTSGNILGPDGETAVEKFIQHGGGFVGIHSAAATESDWKWYRDLTGGHFIDDVKETNKATIYVSDRSHVSTAHLPKSWERIDEWHNLQNQLDEDVRVLAYFNDKPAPNTDAEEHPFSWYHYFDGGRAWVTIGGHNENSYSEINFLKHILGGIRFAAGQKVNL